MAEEKSAKDSFKVHKRPRDDLSDTDDDADHYNPWQSTKTRVAIIGGGPCGMSLLNAFSKEAQDSNVEVVCFEKQSKVGGLWNYDWRTGTDEHGLIIHAGQYRHLWTNAPKECLEMCDYCFDEHFKDQNIGSFPPRPVLQDYILGRVKARNLEKKFDLRLNHHVVGVRHNDKTNKFRVKYQDLSAKSAPRAETFDYLVVASGHFSTPNLVEFKGFDTFSGRILHSHSFRNAQEFKGQNILVIGSSYSAEDIALQCLKFGSKHVTISYRSDPANFWGFKFKWPAGIREAALLKEIVNGKDAVFADGQSVENIDSIILCTGYLHSFPFLAQDLKLYTANLLYPRGLYKGVVWTEKPNLLYLGMQTQCYTFTMFDMQAMFVKDVVLGKVKLPEKEAMMKDAEEWAKRGDASDNAEKAVRFQTAYLLDLYEQVADAKQYVDSKEKLDCTQEFLRWAGHKKEDICTYRDKVFTSKITGKMAAKFAVPWMKSFDDSIEFFLANSQ
eukprot:CAMPEP_0197034460 /NCGR_PEP_ID=MMETSP1384-20130603/12573_1 /TAXON_ID=29189 /ORGANISM="Ammonia sp." /LENGTH=498 /DNA_ID=CAMNT_0042464397 /DNA_START=40 /DNA_END=1536 /DNA_ORIENTATION=-